MLSPWCLALCKFHTGARQGQEQLCREGMDRLATGVAGVGCDHCDGYWGAPEGELGWGGLAESGQLGEGSELG